MKRQIVQLKNEQWNWTDISTKLYTNGQQAHGMMLNIISPQGKAN